VGKQRQPNADVNATANLTQFELGYIKSKIKAAFDEQLMSLCDGDVQEFKELKRSDIATYLLKFEDYYKRNVKESNN
jgi:predicted transcriptional regulator